MNPETIPQPSEEGEPSEFLVDKGEVLNPTKPINLALAKKPEVREELEKVREELEKALEPEPIEEKSIISTEDNRSQNKWGRKDTFFWGIGGKFIWQRAVKPAINLIRRKSKEKETETEKESGTSTETFKKGWIGWIGYEIERVKKLDNESENEKILNYLGKLREKIENDSLTNEEMGWLYEYYNFGKATEEQQAEEQLQAQLQEQEPAQVSVPIRRKEATGLMRIFRPNKKDREDWKTLGKIAGITVLVSVLAIPVSLYGLFNGFKFLFSGKNFLDGAKKAWGLLNKIEDIAKK